MKYADLLSKLTLAEKAALCSGKDFWHLVNIERLGIPSIMVTDGPHGLRKQVQGQKGVNDILSKSVPTTCFPTASATACSWDPELLEKMGEAMGEECLQEQVSVILGPGVNMKRSPLCGRNFEYFSEDPYLAGKIGAGLIKGIQSKGVGTSLKHFAGNNQECRRMSIDTVADERTLREIYLTAFEICVKEGRPWTVMNAYNRLNGTYCSENKWLLTDVLRDEWCYDGLVMTDWGAENDRVEGMGAGQSLEMPSSGGIGPDKIIRAVNDGKLKEEVLDENADRVLELIFKSAANLHTDYTYNKEAHHALARKIASESVVLLKNDGTLLPITDKSLKIAVIGEMARSPRYQGAGSSLIHPTKLDDTFSELMRQGCHVAFAPGYDKAIDRPDEKMIHSAAALAKKADVVLVFAGLTEKYESEGFDRTHIELPPSHNELIKAVAAENPNVAVVLSGGSAVTMPWLGSVKAVLNGMLSGQAGGSAVADVLTGKVNPSGKLAESYPLCLEDTPAFRNFPGKMLTTEYREGLFIGYRYYDKVGKEVLFPFGYGLSYTTFEYSDLSLDHEKMSDSDTLKVTFKVKNTGQTAGAEIAELYVSHPSGKVICPEKELKGFQKVFLEPGEEQTVELTLKKRAFAYYNVSAKDWCVESGTYRIAVGASSRDLRLEGKVKVESAFAGEHTDLHAAAPVYYSGDPADVSDAEFEALLGRPIPDGERDPGLPVDRNCSLEMAQNSRNGARLTSLLCYAMEKAGNDEMLKNTMLQLPISRLSGLSGGVFSEEMGNILCDILNDKPIFPSAAAMVKQIPSMLAKLPTLLQSL